MTASWIVMIIVIAILVFFMIWGFYRGFLRIILTTMALVVTIVLAGVLAPYVSGFLQNSFVGTGIDKRIGTYLEEHIDEPIVNRVETAQEAVIEKLPLPKFMREDISDKNTPGEYIVLQVNNFTDYLRTRLTSIAVSIIAFVLLLILIYILIRILLRLSKVISRIPIIGGINRLFGGIVGLAEGLLVIWCIGLIVMMLSSTPFGMKAVEVINSNAFLKFLYDKNGIVLGINALFRVFLG